MLTIYFIYVNCLYALLTDFLLLLINKKEAAVTISVTVTSGFYVIADINIAGRVPRTRQILHSKLFPLDRRDILVPPSFRRNKTI